MAYTIPPNHLHVYLIKERLRENNNKNDKGGQSKHKHSMENWHSCNIFSVYNIRNVYTVT